MQDTHKHAETEQKKTPTAKSSNSGQVNANQMKNIISSKIKPISFFDIYVGNAQKPSPIPKEVTSAARVSQFIPA